MVIACVSLRLETDSFLITCTRYSIHQRRMVLSAPAVKSHVWPGTSNHQFIMYMILITPEADGFVGAGGKEPRLRGMEDTVQHPLVVEHAVAAEDLHRHNQRVLQ